MPNFVLTSDDEEKSRQRLGSILAKFGWISVPCRTKKETLNMIRCFKPVLVFQDISLNGSLGTEGLEIAQEAGRNNPGLKIYLISSDPDDYAEKILELRQAGLITGCLKKPVKVREVKAILKGLSHEN